MRIPQFEKDRFEMNDLIDLMALLRAPGGCPWDREQTHDSIRKNLIEETYEVLDALDHNDPAALREELGDLLLQVVFHTQMEREAGHFDLNDVITELCQKLIVRHPHIFADTDAKDSDQVLKNWDTIKKATKAQKTFTDTLKAVPKNLPALMRAQKTGHRAARAGMDFADADASFVRLQDEVAELSVALHDNNQANIEDELGDVLFSACNLSRLSGLDAEEVLTKATDKFISRFEKAELLAQEQTGQPMDRLSAQQLDDLWAAAKQDSESDRL